MDVSTTAFTQMKKFLREPHALNSEGGHLALHEADVEVASDASQPLTGLSGGPVAL